MGYIMKKAGMSMLSGAACMFGSWMTKYMLEKGSKQIEKRKDNSKKMSPT